MLSAFFLCGCVSAQQQDKPELTPSLTTAAATTKPEKNYVSENFEKEWKSSYATASAELEKNRLLWTRNKIASYDMVVGKMMGGTTSPWNRLPVIIEVRNGAKTSIRPETPFHGTYMDRLDGFEDIDTVDKMFNYLHAELENGKILKVKYHKKFGYPTNAGLMFDFHSHGTRYITISKLRAVE